MKTTVEISDPLLREAKEVAKKRGTTVRALIEAGLRKEIAERRSRARFSLKDASFRGQGLRDGLQEGDWESIAARAYEGRGG